MGFLLTLVVFLFFFPIVGERSPHIRTHCLNNLKNLTIVLMNYEAAKDRLPVSCTTNENGQPLHSWRTYALPYMEGERLFESIDLEKPWNDPANAKAAETRISLSMPSESQHGKRDKLPCVVTPNSLLRPAEKRKFSDCTDGTSNTIILVEVPVSHSVPWMQPVDADEELIQQLAAGKLGANHDRGFLVAFADGSTEFIPFEDSPRMRGSNFSDDFC
ncbi:MAG: DUF1559 domain-containing protein [Pirellulaceae bacterium]